METIMQTPLTTLSPTIELAKELIQCPSITPHDAGCQQIIGQRLAALGFKCESMPFGEVSNLWARFGSNGPVTVFAGHTDVVPTGPESAWISPPFAPEIRNGFLCGRGATDMKGAVAAMVIAIENFVKQHPHFPGSIALLLTSDEEGPAVNGTQKVIETLYNRQEKIDYCIIGEASSDDQLGDQIRIGRRGSLHGDLIIHGTQGHVAYPQLADNPIHRCLDALSELTKENWDYGNEAFPATTFQISNINAGTGATNVIPALITIAFNFRFSTAITTEELKARVIAILDRYQLRYDIQWQVGAEPFLSNRGKLIEVSQAAIQAVTGLKTRLSTGGGTSDGRFIAPLGIEVIELGPRNASAHHINEQVSIEELDGLTLCYSEILKRLYL